MTTSRTPNRARNRCFQCREEFLGGVQTTGSILPRSSINPGIGIDRDLKGAVVTLSTGIPGPRIDCECMYCSNGGKISLSLEISNLPFAVGPGNGRGYM
jgi:hypothetical protein